MVDKKQPGKPQNGEAGGESEQPASLAAVKQIIRAIKRRQPPHEENFLNIYPMMDMMTILLVFLIMQFASSSASVLQESDELRIPYSTSEQTTDESLPLQISKNEIVVDGKKVLELRDGQVDPSFKQGGGTGFLISPLFRVLEREAERQKAIAARNPSRPFKGEMLIIADKDTPFRTISEVLYTMGQAEFAGLKFIVNKQGE